MPRSLETEVKFYLQDAESIRERILAMGATPKGKHLEINVCFEDRAKTLKATDRLLRLRKADRITLTFKMPPAIRDEAVKTYQEWEIELDDDKACQAILGHLGFQPEQRYEKQRETFVLQSAMLLIDTTPYGTFLEIEGKKSDIVDIARRLDLRWEHRIIHNYLAIFEILRRKEGLKFRDMTFANFEKRPVDVKKYLPLLYAS